MLRAVLQGKAGRIELEERAVGWRQLFQTREDLLTAAIFSRFTYLREDQRAFVCRRLFGCGPEMGRFEGAEFWPKFHRSDGRYAEPDVLLEFENRLLLVEVKPPWEVQKPGQWRREIRAALASEDIDKPLELLALGGNERDDEMKVQSPDELEDSSVCIRVIARTWESLRDAIIDLQERTDGEDPILSDMLEALALYGIAPPIPSWLEFVKRTGSLRPLSVARALRSPGNTPSTEQLT